MYHSHLCDSFREMRNNGTLERDICSGEREQKQKLQNRKKDSWRIYFKTKGLSEKFRTNLGVSVAMKFCYV